MAVNSAYQSTGTTFIGIKLEARTMAGDAIAQKAPRIKFLLSI